MHFSYKIIRFFISYRQKISACFMSQAHTNSLTPTYVIKILAGLGKDKFHYTSFSSVSINRSYLFPLMPTLTVTGFSYQPIFLHQFVRLIIERRS